MYKRVACREMEPKDVELIANYWLDSDKDYLVGLGVDLSKLPDRESLVLYLNSEINKPYKEKNSLAYTLTINEKAAGHCNLANIVFGKEANMHLHIWNEKDRKKGYGRYMVKTACRNFFNKLEIKTIWCEPYAFNPAPTKTLEKLGFEFVKKYTTVPGSLNFEQEVNRYRLDFETFLTND